MLPPASWGFVIAAWLHYHLQAPTTQLLEDLILLVLHLILQFIPPLSFTKPTFLLPLHLVFSAQTPSK